jgi:very-short-patch-repair endonuclease
MTGSGDQAVARIAAGQRTLVTTDQLTACGLGRNAVAHRVAIGWFHPVFHTVYSVGCGELPPLALELAALLACGEKSFISHHSAAFVWGLRKNPPPRVEVTVVGRECRSREGIRVHRIKSIDKHELRRHEGLWISSPARALLEIATTLPRHGLADAVGDGIGNRRVNRREIEATLARNRGRRGSARLAEVIADKDTTTITRSRAERAFLKLIRDSGLPMPVTNQPLGRYVPDFMWPEQRLIVEVDSYTFHGGPNGFDRDHDKDLFYRQGDFDVLRPTRDHVVNEAARVLVLVAQALARRTAN